MHEEGRLYYVGGGKAVKRLVVIGAEERERIVSSIHDEGHLGRDKTLSQINAK